MLAVLKANRDGDSSSDDLVLFAEKVQQSKIGGLEGSAEVGRVAEPLGYMLGAVLLQKALEYAKPEQS